MKPAAHVRFQVGAALLAALAGVAAVAAPLWTGAETAWTWLAVLLACLLLTQVASLFLARVAKQDEAQQATPIDFDAAWRENSR